MVEKISNYIVDNYFYKNETSEEDEREIILFGVKRIVEDLPKHIIITLIFYFSGYLKELGIVFLTTILYKSFVGGAHARTNIGCFIGTLTIMITPVILAQYILSSIYIIIVLIINFIYSCYVLYKLAPSDTEEVPIINRKRRKQLKILGFISLISIYTYIILNFQNKYIIELIIYTMLFINLGTSNLTYRFFKCIRGCESEEYKDLYE